MVTAQTSLDLFLRDRSRRVEAALAGSLPLAGEGPALIREAMRHSLFAGGKRLRPLLVIGGAEAVGGSVEQVLPAACAVEAIHTYSLIHDDLPAMDDAPTRRGLPTSHVLYGEAAAILAGDALHALAFELIASNARLVPAERVVRVCGEIAWAIGPAGMVGGQVLDLLATRAEPSATMVDEIHRRKTGALIRASVRAGAILMGAPEADLAALGAYGEALGYAFQIVDDILDVVGDAAALGKAVGSDAAKATFPAVHGLDRSRTMAREATALAVEALDPLGGRGEILRALAVMLLEREG